MSMQAVIVNFIDYADRFFTPGTRDLSALHGLEAELRMALEDEGSGVLDGHEIAIDGKDGTLYLYGPDARRLYTTVEDILEGSPVTRGGIAFLYHGDVTDDATEVTEIELGGRTS